MSIEPAIEHGTLKSYALGFGLSLALTLAAYFSVVEKLFSGWVLVSVITALALAQTGVQLVLFLHLGTEPKPRSNLLVFLFMLLVLLILVFGSLWIMYYLNYRTMPAMEMYHK